MVLVGWKETGNLPCLHTRPDSSSQSLVRSPQPPPTRTHPGIYVFKKEVLHDLLVGAEGTPGHLEKGLLEFGGDLLPFAAGKDRRIMVGGKRVRPLGAVGEKGGGERSPNHPVQMTSTNQPVPPPTNRPPPPGVPL